jgi:hypothetical protein
MSHLRFPFLYPPRLPDVSVVRIDELNLGL